MISYAIVLAIILFFGMLIHFSRRLIKRANLSRNVAKIIYSVEVLLGIGLCAVVLFPIIQFNLGRL